MTAGRAGVKDGTPRGCASRSLALRSLSMDTAAGTNVPEYSVTEISGAVKRTLEAGFARVRVRGEITELKRYPSGHIYLSLKDENAKIAAVVWRSAVSRLGLAPENGVEVIATGRITAYGERSSYQLVIERLDYAGAGALLARIEALRTRLAAEGLFDAGRKRPLPMLPSVVGVVTSASGAVLHDIRTTIERRFPRDVLLWPVPVQGEGAAARIALAIRGFDRLPAGGTPARPDVLIVARGGGALEDLMAFNDEAVLRAVADCRIPVVSAVGHETDTTLIDFVADRRAPTPTAAAELAVPLRTTLRADLAHRAARLQSALARIADGARHRLERAGRRLPDLPSLLGQGRMRLDDRHHRLALAWPNLLERRRAAFVAAERHFRSAASLTTTRRHALSLLEGRLRHALPALLARRHASLSRTPFAGPVLASRLREQGARLEGWGARLHSVSYENVLARGFALVRRPDGAGITRAADIEPGTPLVLRFADGEAPARAERTEPPRRQGSLPL